jgi:Flp pilus assembly protein TadD
MAQITIQQAFDLALQHHRAGRLREAENLYRQILAHQPNHFDVMHLLGVIAHQTGRNDIALDLIRRAITLRPGYAEAHNNLGNVLRDKGQLDEAITEFRLAITLNPNVPEAHGNLGNVLRDKGQLDEAIAAYRQTIILNPSLPEAHSNLGNALKDKGQFDEAIAAYRQAIALSPGYAEAHSNLGVVLKDKGQLDEAITAYRRAITLRPGYAEAHSNLGNALRDKGQLDDAITACQQAIALNPNLPEAHSNLGNALRDKGQLDDAIAAYRHAVALRPDYAEARMALGMVFLLCGDFSQGWREFEWRLKLNNQQAAAERFAQPRWDGSELTGRTILIHADEGFGDTLQFIRYAKVIVDGGGKIILESQPQLSQLLQQSFGNCLCVVRGQTLGPFDVHCPVASLPLAFGTTLDNIPHQVPYLHADPQEIGKWSERISASTDGLKVGLVWAGNKNHKNDHNRSIALSVLAPLAQVPGVRFFSLQTGEPALQTKAALPGFRIIDWTDELQDFHQTSALIQNLDLVISVDTAVAHLAGAMGKSVWTLLPYSPDWRWLLEREDSPWYPTMRLFRQSEVGDWQGVIERAADALSQLSAR